MKKPIILIHGTWGDASSWDAIKDDLSALNLDVIIPSLRHHDLSFDESMENVGNVSITDYVDDIVEIVKSCDQPPLLLGHSLGCLIAQLVAERIEVKGMILLGPAPTADIFQLYPTMVKSFFRHFMQWGFWYKPMPPYKKVQEKYAMQQQTQSLKEEVHQTSLPESGLVYTQIAFPEFDRKQSTKVDFKKIDGPVLIITGSEDKMTVPQIAKQTARNYGKQARLIMIGDADHYYIAGRFKNQVVMHIQRWLQQNRIN